MAHTSEITWPNASAAVAVVSSQLIEAHNFAEEKYQELIEAHAFSGGSDLTFAELLFYGTIGATNVPTAEEISKAGDLRLAMVAAHDTYLALDFSALRRLS